ncbi:IclR family transcriptional regulator, partial [Mesorhizobium sp. M7A.F.Ca.CA.004.12.1.1]
MAKDVSTPGIFQFFQNIFSFLENGIIILMLFGFLFSKNSGSDRSEKLFHCAFCETTENGGMEPAEKRQRGRPRAFN